VLAGARNQKRRRGVALASADICCAPLSRDNSAHGGDVCAKKCCIWRLASCAAQLLASDNVLRRRRRAHAAACFVAFCANDASLPAHHRRGIGSFSFERAACRRSSPGVAAQHDLALAGRRFAVARNRCCPGALARAGLARASRIFLANRRGRTRSRRRYNQQRYRARHGRGQNAPRGRQMEHMNIKKRKNVAIAQWRGERRLIIARASMTAGVKRMNVQSA